mgnify:CR=1 FL=1
MASIQKKNNKYCVVYYCKDTDGKRKQKWETYDTKNAAKIRKAEIELKEKKGGIIVSNCKTLEDLINEYVELYGKDRWALSTYDGNMSLLKNYILPIIGKTPLTDINTRFLEIYYKTLTKTPSVPDLNGNVRSEFVSTSVIRDVHKLLKSCFNQAVKWDIMEKNPAFKATVPKHKSEKRVIWDAETVAYALDVCENECLKLCMNLAFAGSLRIGDDDDKIRLNQRKPSKYKGLSRFGPEKNLQRINKFMKERPIFYKNLIQMKENFRFYLRCFYCITKVVILQFNSENRTELARNG